jgi:glycosyltransferase involved in cell wall biosynthesis
VTFSVIMPCHNGEKYIAGALKSVAQQVRKPDEVIVVLDACTDQSYEAAAKTGVATKLLETAFGNAAAARNEALHASTGTHVALLDADDYWGNGHLQRVEQSLAESGDVAYTGIGTTFKDGTRFEDLKPDEERNGTWQTGLSPQNFFIRFLGKHTFFNSSTVYSRERLFEVGLHDEEMVRRHDIDLWLRVIAENTHAFDPMADVYYRADTPGAISRKHVEAEYYYLRALVRNQRTHPEADYSPLVQEGARRAVASALTEGDREDVKRAWQLAERHLRPVDRQILSQAKRFPKAFATLNRLKRRLQGYG